MNRRQINMLGYGILGIVFFVLISLILSNHLGMSASLSTLLIFLLLATLFWIWVFIDCVTKEPNMGSHKIAWIITILFTNGFGALIYYIVRRPKRIKEIGR
ncbi:PLD nuclease N-terminal domain-containing protein [Scytonema sp. PCC 10023]|uniref:Cardiolipin synthase N-terminal domain-containing protein n=1 Tax=Scytonema sp. PCC 10023 TaxID=1680591 RepID=A0A2P0ZGV8_9CYAN|nr:hypothetical protein [Scytonema sp. PCC 10023]